MNGSYDRYAPVQTGKAAAEFRDYSLVVSGRPVLKNISAVFLEGGKYLITGPSGAGKSMLALALAGLDGEVDRAEVRGSCSTDGSARSIVFQNPFLQMFHTTVYDEILSSCRSLPKSREEEEYAVVHALKLFGISHCFDKDIFSLSAGERKKVCLAAAVASKPGILILDEPTGYLDREGIAELAAALDRMSTWSKTTVIIFDHRIEPFISGCTEFIVLDGGRQVFKCGPDEVCGHEDVFRRYGLRFPWKLEDVRLNFPSGSGKPDVKEREPVLSAERLSARYGRRTVVESAGLHLYPGEVTALVGDNGSGKTTLAKLIAGVKRKAGGKIRRKNKLRTVMMFQEVSDQLICRTVEEEVRYGADRKRTGPELPEELLAGLDLKECARRMPHSLSVGEQHRTLLAALLVTEPDFLILDEPALGQDWGHLEGLFLRLKDLAARGMSVLVITHDDKLVCRHADRVIRMEKGRITQDEYTQFRRTEN